jgi:hypothetical protein
VAQLLPSQSHATKVKDDDSSGAFRYTSGLGSSGHCSRAATSQAALQAETEIEARLLL